MAAATNGKLGYHLARIDFLEPGQESGGCSPCKYQVFKSEDASKRFLSLKVMPILTTTYPLINSTFNVSHPTLRLIQEKMGQAAMICDQIIDGNGMLSWENLFKVCMGKNSQTFFILFSIFRRATF